MPEWLRQSLAQVCFWVAWSPSPRLLTRPAWRAFYRFSRPGVRYMVNPPGVRWV